jgi:hypothetical protein
VWISFRSESYVGLSFQQFSLISVNALYRSERVMNPALAGFPVAGSENGRFVAIDFSGLLLFSSTYTDFCSQIVEMDFRFRRSR